MKEQLAAVAEEIRSNFNDCDKAREKAYYLHRDIIKHSSLAIRAVHRDEYDEAEKLVKEGHALLEQAMTLLTSHPRILYSGFLEDAQKEYAEAYITLQLISREQLPVPGEIGVEYSAYLNGLAETMGELRRHILDLIRRGEPEKGEKFLVYMDEMFYVLTSLDFPDMITCNLRRRTDIARGILEKTRGDLTACLSQVQLLQEMKKAGR